MLSQNKDNDVQLCPVFFSFLGDAHAMRRSDRPSTHHEYLVKMIRVSDATAYSNQAPIRRRRCGWLNLMHTRLLFGKYDRMVSLRGGVTTGAVLFEDSQLLLSCLWSKSLSRREINCCRPLRGECHKILCELHKMCTRSIMKLHFMSACTGGDTTAVFASEYLRLLIMSLGQ